MCTTNTSESSLPLPMTEMMKEPTKKRINIEGKVQTMCVAALLYRCEVVEPNLQNTERCLRLFLLVNRVLHPFFIFFSLSIVRSL